MLTNFEGNVALNIIYQLVGLLAMVASYISFQRNKTKDFLWLQCLACTLFSVQFFMTKAMTACIMNALCIFRCIFFFFNKNRKLDFVFGGIISLFFIGATVISIVLFKENPIISIVCLVGSITSTFALASKHYFIIRYAQAFIVSPIWIANGIFYLSIGEIISEISNIFACCMSLLRKHREKKQLEAKNWTYTPYFPINV